MDTPLDNYEGAHCPLFTSGQCRSCSLLSLPSGTRVTSKLRAVSEVLSPYLSTDLLTSLLKAPFIPKRPWGSRAKLKYSVGGTKESPTIGILSPDYKGIDLSTCPLPGHHIEPFLKACRAWISEAGVEPYQVKTRSGLLKGIIILSTAKGDSAIVRFVVQDRAAFQRYEASLLTLTAAFPWIKVVTLNVQPLHAAIPEGREEIYLSARSRIEERYGALVLSFGAQSFMQVTPEVGAELYRWVAEECRKLGSNPTTAFSPPPSRALDLFCGVGGFALAISPYVTSVLGIEISADAVNAASENAARNQSKNATFLQGDLSLLPTLPDQLHEIDTVIVNPPRRGLGSDLCQQLLALGSLRYLIYSSCNPNTLATDLSVLSERFIPQSIRAFDMFPLTKHCEVAVVLVQK